jgi:NADPH:quinone reductase-like Zn-dependent oxidoreductase
MRAIVLEGINKPFELKEVDAPKPGDGQVLVRVKAAALNHRDLWIQKGMYAGLRFSSIQGSDGSGTVEMVGNHVDKKWIGKEVIINASLNWGDNPDTQAKDYIILGMAQDGTFADYVCVNYTLIKEKPSHLTFTQAAAIPLAGLTAYRALFTRAMAKAGEHVLITGVGGGVALWAMQYAIAAGCKVFVTSGSDEKIKKAISMGAVDGVNYKDEKWHKNLLQICGGVNVAIDSSGGDTFAKLVDICMPAARIAMYGATLGAFNSGVPAKIFWKQISVLGSTMGSDVDFENMVSFINEHQLIPAIDSVHRFENFEAAFDRMRNGDQFGKIVLEMDN